MHMQRENRYKNNMKQERGKVRVLKALDQSRIKSKVIIVSIKKL